MTYPVELVFQDGRGLALPAGKWRREADVIIARFDHPDELDSTIEATKAIGLYPGLSQNDDEEAV